MRKEINDMTNYEKFKNEIDALSYDFAVTKTQKICFCPTMKCANCIFHINEERSCVPIKVRWLYEEAKEDFFITTQEKDFISILCKDNYIARDYTGQLFIYSRKPLQLSKYWILENGGVIDRFKICSDFFEFITWESNKCWSVAELLRMPVKE